MKSEKKIKRNQDSIDEYNENPKRCKNCKEIIEIGEGERLSITKKKDFCNRSCAATYNGHAFPKRKSKNTRVCPSCGGKKWYQSKLCQNCKRLKTLDGVMKKKLSDYTLYNAASRAKHNQVRLWARNHLKYKNVEKKCKVCGYDKYTDVLEVAHIKRISDFSEDALMGEVNALSNLAYMCPTHHKEFDKGFIDLK